MSGQQVSVALLSVGVIALGATQYLGSPWPGVVLCGLALVPWIWQAWLGASRGRAAQSEAVMGELLAKHADLLLNAQKRLEEHDQQINSLRNAVSLRGTLGG